MITRTPARLFVAYLATGIAFAMIDSVWLLTMATRLYQPEIGAMLTDKFRIGPAVLFYLFYIGGIVIFAVDPGLAAGRWQLALQRGGLFGFFCYMTYDLTNQATLKLWSTRVTLFDLGWGTVLTGLAAAAGMVVTSRLFRIR